VQIWGAWFRKSDKIFKKLSKKKISEKKISGDKKKLQKFRSRKTVLIKHIEFSIFGTFNFVQKKKTRKKVSPKIYLRNENLQKGYKFGANSDHKIRKKHVLVSRLHVFGLRLLSFFIFFGFLTKLIQWNFRKKRFWCPGYSPFLRKWPKTAPISGGSKSHFFYKIVFLGNCVISSRFFRFFQKKKAFRKSARP